MTKHELTLARQGLGLSQAGLAKSIGMGRMTICQMEGGHQKISLRTEMAIKYLALQKPADWRSSWIEAFVAADVSDLTHGHLAQDSESEDLTSPCRIM